MENCFGVIRNNLALRKRLADEISEGRFPHAYIIAGAKGSGKRTLAINIAAALACNNHRSLPCGTCESCQKILGGFSPDVIFVRKDADKKEFTVNLIREIKDSIYIAPNELEKRVYIIEDAETMNQNAQNAFLKVLEEPPHYVVFLLLCSNTESLLETIKSRAPILYTEHIPTDEIKEYLIEHSPKARELSESAPDKLETIALAANGSIGAALSLCNESDKHSVLRNLVFDFLKALTAPSLTELDLFCTALPTESEALSEFFKTLKIALRDIAVLKCDFDKSLLFFSGYEEAEDFVSRITNFKALKLMESVDSLLEKLKFYLDIKLAAVTFCGDARRIMIG